VPEANSSFYRDWSVQGIYNDKLDEVKDKLVQPTTVAMSQPAKKRKIKIFVYQVASLLSLVFLYLGY
jgi:hypothetical protein